MAHTIWPLFELAVTTPRLELRYVDDELAADLAALAATGIHDPEFMPFSVPWTDVESPELERNTMQFYWRCRAELASTSWHVDLAVLLDGSVVGSTALSATEFPTLRQFETGSWLGRAHQGKGLGKEARIASLQLGFAGLGARWATTGAWEDNASSLGVTRRVGYVPQGRRRAVRRGVEATLLGFEMSREQWESNVRRDDIVLRGVDACRPLLGIEPGSAAPAQ